LCLIKYAFWLRTGKGAPTGITEINVGSGLSAGDKMWRACSSMGNIAIAGSYAGVIYDIMVINHNSLFMLSLRNYKVNIKLELSIINLNSLQSISHIDAL
jgi:hypothetical protein